MLDGRKDTLYRTVTNISDTIGIPFKDIYVIYVSRGHAKQST